MASPVRIVTTGKNVDISSDNPFPVSSVRSDLEGGGKVAVGTTPIQVTFTNTPYFIIITADSTNSGLLYVGKSDVSSNGDNALTFLQSGDCITLAYNNDNPLFIVSTAESQYFWKGALL